MVLDLGYGTYNFRHTVSLFTWWKYSIVDSRVGLNSQGFPILKNSTMQDANVKGSFETSQKYIEILHLKLESLKL